MNFNFYQPTPSLASRELLFIGFEKSFDANIHEFPYENKTYYFEIINHAGEALEWLEQRVSDLHTFQLPYAVFCNLEWLRQGNFELAAQLSAHPDLRYVPFIVCTEDSQPVDRQFLLENGIDDCYSSPVKWSLLEKRLAFLNQFKSRLLEIGASIQRESYQYQVPFVKRVFDVVGAVLGIAVSSMIWLPVALAIILESKGPVFYYSKRVGADYRVFDFIKFRSMYQGADQQIAELQHLNLYGLSGNGAVFIKFAQDPRITRVGRFIRKYSIDELPQLINVLRGEMSLVGNRPLPVYEAEMLTRDEWSTRFLAPAGITGLWQVTKRDFPDMSAEERIELDIAYARKYSIWTDLQIIMKTFGAFVQKEDV
ncbi:MAG: sugar transferase [Lewinellaceae bacterium]|nr:sugar transferase [Lewinellaceae bacterium]